MVNEAITSRMLNEFSNLFIGIGCFEGTFSLQAKEGSHPYQAPSRRVAYALKAVKVGARMATEAAIHCPIRC